MLHDNEVVIWKNGLNGLQMKHRWRQNRNMDAALIESTGVCLPATSFGFCLWCWMCHISTEHWHVYVWMMRLDMSHNVSFNDQCWWYTVCIGMYIASPASVAHTHTPVACPSLVTIHHSVNSPTFNALLSTIKTPWIMNSLV